MDGILVMEQINATTSYEELKRERNRLRALLDASHPSVRKHDTYKAVERQWHVVRAQIKQLFHK